MAQNEKTAPEKVKSIYEGPPAPEVGKIRSDRKTLKLVFIATLTAVIFIFELTGIGYIPLPLLSVSIMMLPVTLGGILIGKSGGTILGLMFGITSMMQCFTKDSLGMLFLQVSPWRTLLLNIGTRVIAGFLVALIFEIMVKHDKKKIWSYPAAGLIGALLNTVLYLSALVILFNNVPEIKDVFSAGGSTFFGFVAIIFGTTIVNALVEAVVCTFLVGIIGRVLAQNLKLGLKY